MLDFERGVSASELGRSRRSPNCHGRRQLEESFARRRAVHWGKANIQVGHGQLGRVGERCPSLRCRCAMPGQVGCELPHGRAARAPLEEEPCCGRVRSLVRRWAFDIGCWMLDVGCWMLDVGCWMLDVGCWTLDGGCWMLDGGCWMLDVGRWMVDGGCWMVDGRRSMLWMARRLGVVMPGCVWVWRPLFLQALF